MYVIGMMKGFLWGARGNGGGRLRGMGKRVGYTGEGIASANRIERVYNIYNIHAVDHVIIIII